MDEQRIKKDIARAIEMAESIHDSMMETVMAVGTSNETSAAMLEAVSSVATLKWYLEYIGEEVS